LAGFSTPIFGLVRDATGNFTLGLIAIAIGRVVSAAVVLLLGHDRRLEHIPVRRSGHALTREMIEARCVAKVASL
jgi:Cu/Ag efflux pump CusA